MSDTNNTGRDVITIRLEVQGIEEIERMTKAFNDATQAVEAFNAAREAAAKRDLLFPQPAINWDGHNGEPIGYACASSPPPRES